MPYDWNKSKVVVGLRIVEACRSDLLFHLKMLLNDYHKTSHSAGHYDLLAGIWLDYFMHVCYASWVNVGTAEPVADEEPVLELAATPLEFLDLLVNSPTYHRNLNLAIQRLIAGKKPTAWLQKKESTVSSNCSSMKCSAFSTRAAKKLLKRLLLRTVFCMHPEVLICAPYFKGHPTTWMLAMWKWRRWIQWDDLDKSITVPVLHDLDWRYARSNECVTFVDFIDVLKCLLPLCVPAVFLEGYQDFRDRVLALNKPRPRIVYTANALHNHLTFVFLVAEWREQGTILLCHQHGGGMG